MKKLRSLLAITMAAVLTLGTAVTAMAVTDPEVPTTTLRFNLGGTNSGIMAAAADDETVTLNGYRLLNVEATELPGGKGYAYVYALLEGEGNEPHPLTTIMVKALNEVLKLIDDDVVTEDTLIEGLGKMTGDQPAQFAAAVWEGIQDYNKDEDKVDIEPNARFEDLSTSSTISESRSVEQGYWLFVEDRDGYDGNKPDAFLPILLDTLGETELTIDLKKDAPTIDKEVKDEDGGYSDSNTASIGDTVEFKVTSKVPNMTGYEKYFFVVTDTLSKGLDFNANSVEITIGSGNDAKKLTQCSDADHLGEGKQHDEDCGYVVTSAEDSEKITTVEVVFINFIQYANMYTSGDEGTPITITYSATLNEKAVIGNGGNPNSVKLEYSNDPTKVQTGDPNNPDKPDRNTPTGETPQVETKTYVAGIKLTKVNEGKGSLPDAEFTLTGKSVNKVVVTGTVFVEDETGIYYKLKDGTYTDVAPDGTNDDVYESTETKYTKKGNVVLDGKDDDGKIVVTAITNNDGVVQFDGLGEGIFKIEETRAPAGYNLLKDPIYVNITWKDGVWTASRCDANGDEIEDDETVTVDRDGVIALSVENRTGTELPETGGIGTAIFYAAGVLLVMGAGAMLIYKKRGESM